jgi:hypothetical protein
MEVNTVKPKMVAFRETEPIRRNPLMIVLDIIIFFVL